MQLIWSKKKLDILREILNELNRMLVETIDEHGAFNIYALKCHSLDHMVEERETFPGQQHLWAPYFPHQAGVRKKFGKGPKVNDENGKCAEEKKQEGASLPKVEHW